jgi:hypothetical protein
MVIGAALAEMLSQERQRSLAQIETGAGTDPDALQANAVNAIRAFARGMRREPIRPRNEPLRR